MPGIFTDLMRNIDTGIAQSFSSASQGMTNYILPVGWIMLAISILVWSLMVIEGRIQTPMNDWILKGLSALLILSAAGQFYSSWISAPLFALPDALASAVSGATSATSALDALSDSLNKLIMGIGQGALEALQSWNFGGALMLTLSLLLVAAAGCLLEISCLFNMIYAKIGLSIVLGIGPFFVLCLLWPHTKSYFNAWLNTVLYFVFLTVLTTMIMVLFINIANHFMSKLMGAIAAQNGFLEVTLANIGKAFIAQVSGGAKEAYENAVREQFNILSISIQMVLVFIPMFFVAQELRTLVASLTGGSGGSFGSGAMQMVRTIKSGGKF
ncbi:TrbL/VirB6 plasmid conjugal transfer protein (plasmid) [Janthinobacterium sp. HH102]|uniref:type IV secretion system protein n=1 Tax=Janthinobacterium sp. HH102 TaxID=1537274 RepID=UPI000892E802|nr:type IV secretion system protein [Janthinobacterium sp. HH102]QOU76439.1 TrbL/VirB6 plasmid conjugal transfer protein [Janthinobacterium sp. HH102]